MNKRIKIIASFVAIAIGLAIVGVYSLLFLKHAAVTESKTTPQSKYDVGAPEKGELLELVNAERAKYGVAPLVMDERLNQSAQMKADDMVTYNYFGHGFHDGTRAYQVIGKLAGSLCSYASENIRDNDEYINTSREAFNAWVVSKPHHDAMIDQKYSFTGFGVKNDQVVEHFCVAR